MAETATMTLTEFLLARIAEDEEQASRVKLPIRDGSALGVLSLMAGEHDKPGSHDGPGAAIVISPSRVKAECAAMRRLLSDHGPRIHRCDGGDMACYDADCTVKTTLAAVFADHPDYDDNWLP